MLMLPFAHLLSVSWFQDRTQREPTRPCSGNVFALSDAFAIIKRVIEHCLQQLTHVHPPGFTLVSTLQASRHASNS